MGKGKAKSTTGLRFTPRPGFIEMGGVPEDYARAAFRLIAYNFLSGQCFVYSLKINEFLDYRKFDGNSFVLNQVR